jgi:hypothetical protein
VDILCASSRRMRVHYYDSYVDHYIIIRKVSDSILNVLTIFVYCGGSGILMQDFSPVRVPTQSMLYSGL